MAKKPIDVEALKHDATRKNIPTAEFESVMRAEDKTPLRVAYERRNRDLDPQLVWRGTSWSGSRRCGRSRSGGWRPTEGRRPIVAWSSAASQQLKPSVPALDSIADNERYTRQNTFCPTFCPDQTAGCRWYPWNPGAKRLVFCCNAPAK
jgi:hypothetical protein